MSNKSQDAKNKAKEALEKIKANLPQPNKFGPDRDINFKPNARFGTVNRSRR
jgi:hypothetical protein